MGIFSFHDDNSAPETARPSFQKSAELIGFVPNLIRGMANAPVLAEGYLSLTALLAKSSLTPQEQQILLLAVSRYNGCDYCMAAHAMGADMAHVPNEVVAAARNGQPVDDTRLEALRVFASTMVEKRGWLDDADLEAFFAAGFNQQQVGEVILAVGMKTLSNYFNHIAKTPLDEPLKKYA